MPVPFSRKQMQQPILQDRAALVADIVDHIERNLPEVARAYPRGYLNGIVNEGLKIAFGFGLSDIVYLRMFVDLRWRIAPGYYKEPAINSVLQRSDLDDAAKFEMLTGPAYDAAWEEACAYDGPEEWRGHLYEAAQDDST